MTYKCNVRRDNVDYEINIPDPTLQGCDVCGDKVLDDAALKRIEGAIESAKWQGWSTLSPNHSWISSQGRFVECKEHASEE